MEGRVSGFCRIELASGGRSAAGIVADEVHLFNAEDSEVRVISFGNDAHRGFAQNAIEFATMAARAAFKCLNSFLKLWNSLCEGHDLLPLRHFNKDLQNVCA